MSICTLAPRSNCPRHLTGRGRYTQGKY